MSYLRVVLIWAAGGAVLFGILEVVRLLWGESTQSWVRAIGMLTAAAMLIVVVFLTRVRRREVLVPMALLGIWLAVLGLEQLGELLRQ